MTTLSQQEAFIRSAAYKGFYTIHTTNPLITDDRNKSFVFGSRWLNTVSQEEFVCINNDPGAAVWLSTTAGGGPLPHTAIVNPAVTDDSGDGYAIGQVWINTVTDTVFVATSVAVGVAVWKDVSTDVSTDTTSTSAVINNHIINGTMQIMQRSDRPDKWYFNSSIPSVTYRSTSPTLSSSVPINAHVWSVDAAVSPLLPEYYAEMVQHIERDWCLDLVGTTFTISFWVSISIPGTYCVVLRNGDNTRSYVANYTVTSANTFERKSITISGGIEALGASVIGLRVCFGLLAGDSFCTNTIGSWITGAKVGAYFHNNAFSVGGSEFKITCVQLAVGTSLPDKMYPHSDDTLRLCQKFFCKSVYGNIPVTANNQAHTYSAASVYGSTYFAHIPFPVPMIAIPTITYYPGALGTTGQWTLHAGSAASAVTMTNDYVYRDGFNTRVAGVIYALGTGNWTAEAEI